MAVFLSMGATLILDAKSVLIPSFVNAMGVSAVLNDYERRPGQRRLGAARLVHNSLTSR